MTNVTIIIPAFNEEHSIGGIVQGIKALGGGHTVLVVDDGSQDKTSQIARDAGATVLRHPYNIGYGSAIKNGLRHAGGEAIVLMDGDGQHDPGDIPALLRHLGEYDLVVGARTPKSKGSAFRTFGISALTLTVQLISGFRIPDLTSGFRAVKRSIVLPYLPILPSKFSLSTTVTLAFLRGGNPVKFVPLDTIRRRTGGTSKFRPIRDGLWVLITIIRMVGLFSPLRVFLPASIVATAFGLGSLGMSIVRGTPRTDSYIPLFAGILLFFLGLLADHSAYIRRAPKDP